MPFTTKSHHLATGLPSRCLLLALTLSWLAGCAMIHPKKGVPRDPFHKNEKFSCGERIPKGDPR